MGDKETYIACLEARRVVLPACEGSLAQKHPVGQERANELQAMGLVIPVPQQALANAPIDVLLTTGPTDLHKVSVDEAHDIGEEPTTLCRNHLSEGGKVRFPAANLVEVLSEATVKVLDHPAKRLRHESARHPKLSDQIVIAGRVRELAQHREKGCI